MWHLLMTVSSDRVSLTNVWPEQNDRPNPRPEDKTPVTGSYIDYTTRRHTAGLNYLTDK